VSVRSRDAYSRCMSAIDPMREPEVLTVLPPEEALTVLPPEEALRRARPVPVEKDLRIEGLTDAEWAAFEKAIAER